MKHAIAVGSYDGVHLGHQKILNEISNYSKKNNIKSLVIYFPIPPRLYINKNWNGNIITTSKEREKLIKSFGIDRVIKLDFNRKLSEKTALEFFSDFIVKKFNPDYIVVGRDFSIGRNRQANHLWLKEICKINKFKCKILNFVKYRNHKVSSSLIRHFLHCGMIKEANACLGRRYSLTGTVIKGAGIGRKMGYPTANLKVDNTKILPRGIYAVEVELQNMVYFGVASIGIRPTLKTLGMKLIAEVHILNFDKNIYGEKIEICFVEKIRNEMRFKDIHCLVSQIEIDIKKARFIFTSNWHFTKH